MNNTYKIYFNIKNLGLYGSIPGIKEANLLEFTICMLRKLTQA